MKTMNEIVAMTGGSFLKVITAIKTTGLKGHQADKFSPRLWTAEEVAKIIEACK